MNKKILVQTTLSLALMLIASNMATAATNLTPNKLTTTIKQSTPRKIIDTPNINFNLDESEIKEDDYKILDAFVEIAKTHPNKLFLILGYCDVDEDNSLAMKRADNVKTYLVSQGITAQNLRREWFGSWAAKAANERANGGELNHRRVHIMEDF